MPTPSTGSVPAGSIPLPRREAPARTAAPSGDPPRVLFDPGSGSFRAVPVPGPPEPSGPSAPPRRSAPPRPSGPSRPSEPPGPSAPPQPDGDAARALFEPGPADGAVRTEPGPRPSHTEPDPGLLHTMPGSSGGPSQMAPIPARARPPRPPSRPAAPGRRLDRGPLTVARVGLHLLLAAVPLLAISAQVFGLMEMRTALAWLIVPGVIVVAGVALSVPHPVDRILTAGLVWGVVGCVLYDLFRLDTVYVLGWWGDFIPTMGSWVSGGAPGAWDGALVGYVWRYLGDGGGIGITFFVLAASLELGRRSRRDVVAAAVAFAVFPVWAGLIGTVALAPRGRQMLFPLTFTTVVLSLIGHLIFGLILGLGYWRARHVEAGWPWPVPPLPFLPRAATTPVPPRRRAARHAR